VHIFMVGLLISSSTKKELIPLLASQAIFLSGARRNRIRFFNRGQRQKKNACRQALWTNNKSWARLSHGRWCRALHM